MNEEIEKKVLPYHEPDAIWLSFKGITDFESFITKFVKTAQFHQNVPESVTKSYRVAEHLMAYSWYHYPVIDEALVKLLRTMELAIKLRCGQLGIPLLDPKGTKRNKNLISLIDELGKIEPDKDIAGILHWLRGVRNYLMHPDRETLFGTIALNHIRQCLIMYNAIFLPNDFFRRNKDKSEEMRSSLKNVSKNLCVLEHTGFRYIVYEADIIEAYEINNKWFYLFAAQAVSNDFAAMLVNDCYPTPIVYTIMDVEITDNKISGKVMECGEPFNLIANTHLQNVQTLTSFEDIKKQMTEHQECLFQMSNDATITSERTIARLKFWSQV